MTSRMHVRVKTSLLLHKGYLICTHLEDTPPPPIRAWCVLEVWPHLENSTVFNRVLE